MALRDLSPALRAPLLGLGLGAVAGGGEALELAATLKLSLSFSQALVLALVTVGMDAVLGLLLALPVGLAVQLLTRRTLGSRRHALAMAVTAALLGGWFVVPAARDVFAQGRIPVAVGFLLLPVGLGGVVWLNARYWLRREELGDVRRLGWMGVSLSMALVLALGAAGAMSLRRFGDARAPADAPAVILVTIDTLRRDHLSAYAEEGAAPPVQTPVFDALAAQGVRYDDAITPFPETAPAHSAMFTGLHPYRTGMLSNGHRLSPGFQTLAEVLHGQGYATAAFLSSFAVDSRTGLDQGFEVYDDELFPWVRGFSEILAARLLTKVVLRFGDPLKFDYLLERPAPITMGLALRWLDRNADRPFFLWVHTFDVHSPYEPHGLPGFEDNGRPGSPSIDHRWILANERDYTYTDEARARLRRLYAEEVAWTDAELGRFLEQVRAKLGDRPVLLIVTADHGEQLGEHGIEMNHHGVYEEAVRVPLVIQAPGGVGQGRVVGEQVRLMDLPATVLARLGVDPAAMGQTESMDLLSFLDRPDQAGPATLVMGRKSASLSQGTLFGYRANARKAPASPPPPVAPSEGEATPAAGGATPDAGQAAASAAPVVEERGRIKYILDPDLAREELYDLSLDPHELQDVAPAQAEVVQQMRARVAAETGITVTGSGATLHFERSTTETEQHQAISAEEQAMLEALGYIQGEEP